jgi:hypothetical protein
VYIHLLCMGTLTPHHLCYYILLLSPLSPSTALECASHVNAACSCNTLFSKLYMR